MMTGPKPERDDRGIGTTAADAEDARSGRADTAPAEKTARRGEVALTTGKAAEAIERATAAVGSDEDGKA